MEGDKAVRELRSEQCLQYLGGKEVKPRIRKEHNVWSCTSGRILDGRYQIVSGYGYSMEAAWDEWLNLMWEYLHKEVR